MKKRNLFLLPLFCLLLAGCDQPSDPGDDPIDPPNPPVVVNNASLSATEKSLVVDEIFTLNVLDVPTGMTPAWSLIGNTIRYEISNSAKTSALVTGVTSGESTIKVTVGEKELSCVVTVEEEPPVVINDARFDITSKTIVVDGTFTLSITDCPEDMTPEWSLAGSSVKFDLLSASKTSALVTALSVGDSRIKAVVGEKNLTCDITVEEKPIIREPLPAPVLKLNADKSGLIWDAITGAQSYIIKVNDEAAVTQTNPGYTFSQTEGSYTVKVIAKADLEEYNSSAAEFTYQTKITNISELSFENDLITWTSFVGLGLEYKFGDGEFAPVTGASIDGTVDGTYTVHALNGYDETNNILYVPGANATRTIDVHHYTKLETPVTKYNTKATGLTWKEIEGATGYSIKVNDLPAETVTEPNYTFSTVPGEYTVTITALAPLPEFNSDSVTFSYEVKYTSMGELSFADYKITWASFVGLNLEYKLNDGKYKRLQSSEVIVKRMGGVFTFHATAGFDKTGKIYYVDSDTSVNTRGITAIPDKIILEDGTDENNTDLMDRYTSEKYTSDWEASPKTKIFLEDEVNKEYTVGNCARVHFWANGTSYRFLQDIVFPQSYDTLSFNLKGNNSNNNYFIIRLIVNQELVVNDVSLTGVYAQYKVSNPSTKWHKYTANLNDDDCWTITYGSTDYKPSQIKTMLNTLGFEIDSWTDLLGYFDTCAFTVKGETSNGAEKDFYIDDVEFTNEHATSSVERIIIPTRLRKAYSLTTAALAGELLINDDLTTGTFKGTSNGSNLSVDVTLAVEGEQLTITSGAPRDFVLNMETDDGGATWSFVSSSGTLKFAVSNATLGEMLTIDDLSAYTETGIGFDSHHSENFSGLRVNYYCDYYEKNDNPGADYVESPVGGPNWWLMGSDDYMDYYEEGCLNPGSMRIKSSNYGRNMRYLSIALSHEDPVAPALGKGYNKMSVMMKGGSQRDVKVCLFAYYRTSIDKTTQQSDRTGNINDELTVEKDSNWKRYTLNLDPSKTYYGIMILVKGGSSTDTAAYVFVDNICFYK